MTPIEKASKLTSYYLPFCNDNLTDSKYCALIAVDEILKIEWDEFEMSGDEVMYWKEVKQEIQNL